ncbi:MAG: helical backbone metal receptor, partial [Gracilimonas sp.]
EKYSEVRVTEIDTIQDALIEINILGDMLGVKDKSRSLIQTITNLLDQKPDTTPLSVAYLIWKDPWMTVGKDTYIHDVLQEFNLVNVFGDQLRYPKISFQKLASKNPDLILLSSEPYPFKEKHLAEMQKNFPVSKIQLVNGEWFSWYGSRMIKAFEWLNGWRSSL